MTLIIDQFAPTSKRLALQTFEGNNIDNEQFDCIAMSELNLGKSYEKAYSNAIFKGVPTPVYNCHGFTFGSRRTGIFEEAEIEKILKDDKYVEIKDEKQVLPGDVILYYKDGELTHSGLVIQSTFRVNDLPEIIVLSKWSKFKEVIHNANYSPYSDGIKKYRRINHGLKVI